MINTLFGSSYFCIDCQRPFGKMIEHSTKCVRKCRDCGLFADGNCKAVNKPQYCADCCKIFVNGDCFTRHLGAYCRRFHRCKKCGVTYDTKTVARLSPNKIHDCEHKFCTFCNTYHRREQPCYIQPLELSKDDSPVRFVAFDIETTQNSQVSENWFQHEVIHYVNRCAISVQANMLCARVACSTCFDSGDWKDKGHSSCGICGPERTKKWSGVDGKDPLKEFMHWLLHGTNKRYPSYVYSHFGGRLTKGDSSHRPKFREVRYGSSCRDRVSFF